MLLDEDRLRHHGTQAAGTQEPGERGNEMNEKNDQIALFIIVTKPRIASVVSQISNSPGTGWPVLAERTAMANVSLANC